MQQQGSDNYAGMSSPPPEMLSFGGGGGGSNHEHAEAASPISSRPPASGSINFDELVADHDRGGSSSGNRWPRQETLALLNIRSDMDVAFRDSTLKGPLWDEVSRKLGELGYVRSAKKCKEKFENVHKYYKRTKEVRAGRQDGKTYRFFTQLEAMQATTGSPNLMLPSNTTSQQQAVTASGPPNTVASASVGNIVHFATPVSVGIGGAGGGGGVMQSGSVPFTVYSSGVGSGAPMVLPPAAAVPVGINFSSDSASSGSSDSDDEVDDMMSDEDLDQPDSSNQAAAAAAAGSGQKRKRSTGGVKAGKRSRMMDFFEGLMKQVMQKQEAMQHKFLETIEKREQDRLMREEAWKQQEAERLRREQQLAAQERAMAASRDAAIVSFLHKITGQTIQLPPQPQPQHQPIYTTTTFQHVGPTPTPASAPSQSRQEKLQPENNTELVIRQQQNNQMPPPPIVPGNNDQVIMAVPERQIPPQGQEAGSSEPASSRWPKAEVLALIKLRSNLENRYLEAGPKGPLWEEISAGMQRIGYNRSSKRCKEKWENINKYFKKVKESNKKRPEDAKTCPYFNELDALYQRKKHGSSSGSSIVQPQQQQQQQATNYLGHAELEGTPAHPIPESGVQQGRTIFPRVELITERADGSSDQVQPNNEAGQDDNVAVGSRKPEDIMMEQKQLGLDEEYNQQKTNELGDNSADDEDDEDESEEDRKMGYKIDQFQRPPTNNKNGEAPSSSFNITMVQ